MVRSWRIQPGSSTTQTRTGERPPTGESPPSGIVGCQVVLAGRSSRPSPLPVCICQVILGERPIRSEEHRTLPAPSAVGTIGILEGPVKRPLRLRHWELWERVRSHQANEQSHNDAHDDGEVQISAAKPAGAPPQANLVTLGGDWLGGCGFRRSRLDGIARRSCPRARRRVGPVRAGGRSPQPSSSRGRIRRRCGVCPGLGDRPRSRLRNRAC